MPLSKPLQWYLTIVITWGCSHPEYSNVSASGADGSKAFKRVQGPIPGVGPFDTYLEALLAACPLILSQKNATAGHPRNPRFYERWRGSSEYCAWLYYTPAGKYELSMLVEDPPRDDALRKGCKLPTHVEDKRFPLGSLKHVFILHNHPGPLPLSDRDFLGTAKAARIHGGFVETKEGKVPLSVIAFYANKHEPTPPACDGFLMYSFATSEVSKWTPGEDGHWQRKKTGTVTWLTEERFLFNPE